MKIRRVVTLASLLGPVQCAAQQGDETPTATVEEAAASITGADFAWKVGLIAHDSMAGRNTPSPGLDKTAAWVASEFQRLGLRGGAEGGAYIQRYPLRSRALDVAASSLSDGTVTLRFGEDLLPVRSFSVSMLETGPLVVASGSAGPSLRLEPQDVRGAHVAVVAPRGTGRVDRSTQQLATALQNAGALSVLLVNPVPDALWATAARRALQASVTKGWGDDDRPAPVSASASLYVRGSALERLLGSRGVDLTALERRAGQAVRLDAVAGPPVTLTIEVDDPEVSCAQRGRGPRGQRPRAPVRACGLFRPHRSRRDRNPGRERRLDLQRRGRRRVGNRRGPRGRGGDGVARTPPKRSMVFLLVSGEEKGLWGSEWYSEHPTVPVEQLVANLNTDMVGRNWPDTIVAIGKEHSDLGETLDRVNAAHPELGMTAIDDLWPEESFYFRSDHFNFARRGVPVLFFFNGTHDDYHGRDDEPDRVDTEKAARIARLVFYLGMDIGNADRRPEWNPESYRRIVSDRE